MIKDNRLEWLAWGNLILLILLLCFLSFINYKVNRNRMDIDLHAIDIQDLRIEKEARDINTKRSVAGQVIVVDPSQQSASESTVD